MKKLGLSAVLIVLMSVVGFAQCTMTMRALTGDPGNSNNGTVDIYVNGVYQRISPTQANNDLKITVNIGDGIFGYAYNASIFIDGYATYRYHPFASWSSSFSFSCNVSSLPITLVKFDAKRVGSSVKVTWASASEVNNEKYVVERSIDGENFESIGIVAGAGNSTKLLSYEYYDSQPITGLNYYRLKQIDFDGQNETFHTVAVSMDDADKKIIKILDMQGKELSTLPSGQLVLIYYSDGSVEKKIMINRR